ncbi:MAG: phospholipase D-like domain-containing protein [Myxococcota bacterium]
MTDTQLFDAFFDRTLDDGRMSRNEAKVLKELVAEHATNPQQIAQLRSRAFALAQERLNHTKDRALVQWLEDVVKALHPTGGQASVEEAWFFPDDNNHGLNRLQQVLAGARASLDICVFTITHNVLRDAILDAHKRNVTVRIISDDDKAHDRGSDVIDLARSGIDVRIDRTEHHMHHKFAIIDGRLLLNGSFNWTRSASAANYENIQATNAPGLVRVFQEEFDRLWELFG